MGVIGDAVVVAVAAMVGAGVVVVVSGEADLVAMEVGVLIMK